MSESQGSPNGVTYGKMLKALREERGYTQKGFGEMFGVAISTIGNIECYPHRVIRRDKLERGLARLNVSATLREKILAAYDVAPISEFAQKRRERFAKQREQRNKARSSDGLRDALAQILTRLAYEGVACDCESARAALLANEAPNAAAYRCELCVGMIAIGVHEGWVDPTSALTALDRFAEPNEPAPTGLSSAVDNAPVDDAAEFG